MSSRKSAPKPPRRDVHRTNVEIPTQMWAELQAALKLRAARIKQQHGIEVKTSFTAWLKAKAEESIAAYK